MKRTQSFKRNCSIGIATLLTGAIAFGLADAAPRKDAYTVYADDGYYSETTYFLTEESYQSVTAQAPQQNTGAQKLSAKTEQPSNFVMAVEKKVWVEETVSAHGVVDSRLLKKAEIEENQVIENEAYAVPTAVTANPSEVGRDDETHYSLRIYLYVAEVNGVYTATGMAWWEQTSPSDAIDTYGKHAETSRNDYLSLTWGGLSTMIATSHYFYAHDFSDNEISGSRCISNSYAGYVWQFLEKQYDHFLSSIVECATCVVDITKGSGPQLGLTTNIALTYIHTYNNVNTTIGLEINSDGFAGSISASPSANLWQIQVDVGNINY
ncbi:MAG: hypothetical protein J6C93_01860 [Clostridia bacterium]|nr:hypothetical protein [Clostridia bacterium]